MALVVSSRAASIKRSLRSSCVVEAFDPTAGTEGYDDAGQELYAAGRTAACKIAPKFVREARINGDIIGAWGTVIIFAADDPITDKDRITLTDLPDRGPIIATVTYGFDHRGAITHKEVLI
jgi:hypothetical protein